jgi:hypothetical protein
VGLNRRRAQAFSHSCHPKRGKSNALDIYNGSINAAKGHAFPNLNSKTIQSSDILVNDCCCEKRRRLTTPAQPLHAKHGAKAS